MNRIRNSKEDFEWTEQNGQIMLDQGTFHSLLAEHHHYNLLLENTTDTVFEYDCDKDIMYTYGVFFDGTQPEGRCFIYPRFRECVLSGDLVHIEDIHRFACFLEGDGDGYVECRFHIREQEEEPFMWIRIEGHMIRKTGYGTMLIGCYRDIHEQKLIELNAMSNFYRDQLTGFYQADYAERLIDQRIDSLPESVISRFYLIELPTFQTIEEEEGRVYVESIAGRIPFFLQVEHPQEYVFAYLSDGVYAVFCNDETKDEIDIQQFHENVQSIYCGDDQVLSVSIACVDSRKNRSFEELLFTARLLLELGKDFPGETVLTYDEFGEDCEALLEEFPEFELPEYPKVGKSSLGVKKDLVSFSLILLEEVKKLDSGIKMLLRITQGYHNLASIMLIEGDALSHSVEFWIMCGRNSLAHKQGQVITFDNPEDYHVLQELLQRNRQFDFNYIEKKNFTQEQCHVLGLFASASQQWVGMNVDERGFEAIIFEKQGENDEFSETESLIFAEISKIISANIERQRSDYENKTKNELVRNLSKEIRTPLNSILGTITMAKGKLQEPEVIAESMTKIEKMLRYLSNMVNDFSDVVSLEQGELRVRKRLFDLSEFLTGMEVLFTVRASENGIHFTIESDLMAEKLIGDEIKLSQILVNLIENAFKYTPEGGSISLKVKQRKLDQTLMTGFELTDTGVGFSEEIMEKINNQGTYRRDGMVQQTGQGGLGLEVCGKILHLMDSCLKIESKKDEGSILRFELELPSAKNTDSENSVRDYAYDFSGKKVLVVEDNELSSEILRSILESVDFEVEQAYDGKEAIDMFSGHEPGYYSVILMDAQMPVMDGLTATRFIRQMEREDAETIPIIAMTANELKADEKKSMESGMDGHLIKPVDVSLLFQVLDIMIF